MANYATLKAAIAAVIKQNGNNEITGQILQNSLTSMIDSLGTGYQFMGVATPATDPGVPDQRVFYIAASSGTYVNFNATVLVDGEMAILKYDTAWTKTTIANSISEDLINQILLAVGLVDDVNYKTVDSFHEHVVIGSNGAVSTSTYRSTIAFEILDGATAVQQIKSDGNAIVFNAISWYNQRPNFIDSTGFIQRDDFGTVGPANIPSNAKWGVVDIDDSRIGNIINIFQNPYFRIFDDKLSVKDYENFNLGNDDNYRPYVIENHNVGTSGEYNYYAGRHLVVVKLKENVSSLSFDGPNIIGVGWWSGVPYFLTGATSNFITRTNSLGLISGAKYVTIAFAGTIPDTIKVIQNTETTGIGKVVLATAASYINNSVGENNFANGIRTNLKILGYGNSFMRNSVAYLSQIAKGIDNTNLIVGNLYTGGTNLLDHLNALINNTSPYEWYKYVDGVQVEGQTNQTARRGLLAERWDAIILHQYTPWTQPFEPYLNQLIAKIIEVLGYTPKFYLNATWAGHEDYVQEQYGFPTEQSMWEYMLNAVKGACEDSGINKTSIIPTGTAIQNARTLSYADSYNRFVNGGTDWHHLNPAGGFIAACTLWEKIVYPLNGKHCNLTTFRITSATSMPPSTSVEAGILVTDANYQSMCDCAIDAVANPDVITQQ